MLYSDPRPDPPRLQTHPLYATDRSIVDTLLAHPVPEAQDIADAARLLTRYRSYPGCFDIQSDLEKVLRIWNLTHTELNDSARSLWRSGWRPRQFEEQQDVGSGADVAAS